MKNNVFFETLKKIKLVKKYIDEKRCNASGISSL